MPVFFRIHEGKDEKASTKGVFAPLVGMLGCMQAAEALKIIGKVRRAFNRSSVNGGCPHDDMVSNEIQTR